MSFLSDPARWFWETVAAAIQGTAAPLAGIVKHFLFSTTDVLGGPGPFTESTAIARFQPTALVIADAALAAVVIWGSYHIMFSHGMRTLYTVRILLPRLLLVVVLVNFSLPLLQSVIDANNALCEAILGIGVGFDPARLMDANRDLYSGPGLSLLVVALLFGGYGVLAVVYALRYSLLVVLTITAPLAALAFVLPDTHHYARRWGSLLVATVFMQPLQLLVLEVGLQLDLASPAWNPARHLFALATLLIAFKVPGALNATSTTGTHAMTMVKHYAHLAAHAAHLP